LQEEAVIDGGIAGGVSSKGHVLTPASVSSLVAKDQKRMKTGMNDVDTVLGGGIVAGSVNLIAGQPGIGKSTILLQIANAVAQKHKVLYVSGEESGHQVGLRAQRLGVASAELQLATTTSADDIATTIADKKYELVVVDSIQTMAVAAVSSAAGSVSQITNSTQLILNAAK